jgi:hypothetical protein
VRREMGHPSSSQPTWKPRRITNNWSGCDERPPNSRRTC